MSFVTTWDAQPNLSFDGPCFAGLGCSLSQCAWTRSCTEMRFAEPFDGFSHYFSPSVVGLHGTVGEDPQTGLRAVRTTSVPWQKDTGFQERRAPMRKAKTLGRG